MFLTAAGAKREEAFPSPPRPVPDSLCHPLPGASPLFGRGRLPASAFRSFLAGVASSVLFSANRTGAFCSCGCRSLLPCVPGRMSPLFSLFPRSFEALPRFAGNRRRAPPCRFFVFRLVNDKPAPETLPAQAGEEDICKAGWLQAEKAGRILRGRKGLRGCISKTGRPEPCPVLSEFSRRRSLCRIFPVFVEGSAPVCPGGCAPAVQGGGLFRGCVLP